MTTTVAVFDFDGTLTDRDSLVPFLIHRYGRMKTYLKFALLTPWFTAYLMKGISRQQMKELILARFLRDTPVDSLKESAEDYAKKHLDKYLKRDILERLQWHQSQGHRCVIISASIDVYLIPWANEKGIQDVLASELHVTPKNTVTGRLKGKNCWGPEKSRRLIELLGPKENFYLYAYGDSPGDFDLLSLADSPHKV